MALISPLNKLKIPIVGSPLPIMSYGGSSMLATMIGFGIVMSARVHNQQLIA